MSTPPRPPLIPAPHTVSGVRYVYPHRSGKWRGIVRLGGRLVPVPGMYWTKAECFYAALAFKAEMKSGAGLLHPVAVA